MQKSLIYKKNKKKPTKLLLLNLLPAVTADQVKPGDWSARFYTKEVQPWMLMWFSGNVNADEMSGGGNPLLPEQR